MASQSVATGTAAQNQAVAQAQQTAVANAAQAISMQQQFIIESFRGQIYISNELDVQDTPIYDTDTYTSGQTINTPNSAFFSNVESNSGKTFAQTNMSENRRLAAPEAFSVFGVRPGLVGKRAVFRFANLRQRLGLRILAWPEVLPAR